MHNTRCRDLVPMIALAGSLILSACGQLDAASPAGRTIQMYKNASCQCCSRWAAHLRNAGFKVETHIVSSLTLLKSQTGVPQDLRSCHTAIVDGYVVEGHVPLSDIQRLLAERPSAKGLAVPGMPVGSPGMEQGNRHDSYDVMLFDEDGDATVYASH